jgi:hypothetical protein
MVSVATCVVSMTMLSQARRQEMFCSRDRGLVVGHDGAEVGVGVADVDRRGIAALDVDRWGSAG